MRNGRRHRRLLSIELIRADRKPRNRHDVMLGRRLAQSAVGKSKLQTAARRRMAPCRPFSRVIDTSAAEAIIMPNAPDTASRSAVKIQKLR